MPNICVRFSSVARFLRPVSEYQISFHSENFRLSNDFPLYFPIVNSFSPFNLIGKLEGNFGAPKVETLRFDCENKKNFQGPASFARKLTNKFCQKNRFYCFSKLFVEYKIIFCIIFEFIILLCVGMWLNFSKTAGQILMKSFLCIPMDLRMA